jgi:hypothetical protein
MGDTSVKMPNRVAGGFSPPSQHTKRNAGPHQAMFCTDNFLLCSASDLSQIYELSNGITVDILMISLKSKNT